MLLTIVNVMMVVAIGSEIKSHIKACLISRAGLLRCVLVIDMAMPCQANTTVVAMSIINKFFFISVFLYVFPVNIMKYRQY